MKFFNIYSLALFALSLLTFSSCLSDTDDVFSEKSSIRMEEAMNNAKKILTSAKNGWVMDYAIGDSATGGSYAYIVKFDSLNCTIWSELDDKSAQSYYKMSNDNGVSLNFDTYNSVFHALSTPSAASYEASHADYEFRVMSATAEKVVLAGKKTGNTINLYPLAEGETPEQYLAKVNEQKDAIIIATAKGELNGKQLDLDLDLDSRTYNLSASGSSLKGAFAFTDKGIRLDKEFNVDGTAISNFSFDSAKRQFNCLDANAQQLTLVGFLPDTYREYTDYAGEYWCVLGEEGELDSIEVTLVPDVDGSSFKMKGLFTDPNLGVVVNYNKSKGALSMNTQVLANPGSSLIYFNAASFKNGSGSLYPAATTVGLYTEYNKDAEHPVYEWKPNVNEYLSANSFCLWEISGSNSEQYSGSAYSFANGYRTLAYIKSLIKK